MEAVTRSTVLTSTATPTPIPTTDLCDRAHSDHKYSLVYGSPVCFC